MAQPALQPHFYPMHSGPFTPADREAMPEDRRRVELIDGCLVVSPSAGRAHNDVVMHLRRMTVLELEEGGYVQRAVVAADDVVLERPFPVTVHLRGVDRT